MVRQVISLHCGQAGLRTGCALWELLLAEHGLTYEGFPGGGPGAILPGGAPLEALKGELQESGGQTSHDECFFAEGAYGRRVPRCALLDLDYESHSEIQRSPMWSAFAPFSVVKGKEDGACLFPRGRRLGSCHPIRGFAEDAVRRQLEATDMTGGILSMRSLGGGAGSGFGEEILSLLSEDAPKVPLLEVLLWPSSQSSRLKTASQVASQSASCLEPYNALLAAEGVIERGGGALLLDNAAIASVYQNALTSNAHPFTGDLNRITAQVLSSLTLSLRFPSASTCGISDLLGNAIPLPSLSFLSVSYAPLVAKAILPFVNYSTRDVTLAAFKQRQTLFSANYVEGMFLTANLLYRGDISPGEVQKSLFSIKKKKEHAFVDWIPTGFKASLCPQEPLVPFGGPLGAPSKVCCLIANHTANALQMKRTLEEAKKMLAKRAFLFRYVSEGMEEGEFDQAIERMQTILDDYEDAEVVYEYYYPEEEEDEEEEKEGAPKRAKSIKPASRAATTGIARGNNSPVHVFEASRAAPTDIVGGSDSPKSPSSVLTTSGI